MLLRYAPGSMRKEEDGFILNPITAFIGRRLVKTKFSNLVNILLDKEVIPELIQEKCNSDLILNEIKKLLDNAEISELQLKNFDIAIKQLTNNSAKPSDKAANIILNTIKSYDSKQKLKGVKWF